ncbi:hypothetical protein [Intestinibacter sp.]
MAQQEEHKHRKTGIVIILSAILVLIMHLYILSALLFLTGLVVIMIPLRVNAYYSDGINTKDDGCNCEGCKYRCNDPNCDSDECDKIDLGSNVDNDCNDDITNDNKNDNEDK